jgi:hypothetical protein
VKAVKSKVAPHARARPHLHPLPPDVAAEFDDTIVVERPDGFYLCWKSGSRESGPFASLVEAIESERVPDEAEADALAALAEAEADLGVCDWIDPETLAPAEDHIPRLEDH